MALSYGNKKWSLDEAEIPTYEDTWHLRVEVKEEAENIGGCILFGKGFGNYDQDIKIKMFYS
ncbi:TPA: transcriptional regulator [Enterococcus faecium]|nr:transcriptional regulator [Enterococcus faecium]HAP7812658.1 transcriptional regulator [Enterococcus faecium]HAY6754479.1 transcriptional regulator [Enterococcus faecium]HAY6763720.1 transcriptional regulator [Enterococcus faecium]HAY6769873.1 transcriptional regulator [Enterococcus faecium]